MKSSIFILTGIAFLASACNISTGDRDKIDDTQQIEMIDPCRESQALTHKELEDFELGIASTWWLSTDGTGTVDPMPGREPEATLIEGGRCGVSKYALNIRTEGTTIFGGAMGLNFMFPTDASEYDGIAFWGRVEPESNQRVIFFGVSETNTDEWSSQRYSEDDTPSCLEVTDDDSQKCDRFGIAVGLGEEWRFIKLPFSKFAQRGYGQVVPEGMDTTNLFGLNIGFGAGDFNFWIDDISFYKE
ncbi:MAG: hypothetical protein JXX29_18935 [Deltaproteobacteria bacterium]|nr:hypothetical protein [Deltaproteobacteria bacterium]MBN2673762.1 hypothetical protein [Deltaproteobacteria bacterium]